MPSLSERLGINPPCDACRCATFIYGDPYCELTRGVVDCPHLSPADRKAVDKYARENHIDPNPAIDEALDRAIHSLKNSGNPT
jgi:hypothetical protein